MKNDWKNSRENCLGVKTDGRDILPSDNEDFRRLKSTLRRWEMSALKTIDSDLNGWRVKRSLESSQGIPKLAPLVREINRIHNIGSTQLISAFLEGVETAGATDD